MLNLAALSNLRPRAPLAALLCLAAGCSVSPPVEETIYSTCHVLGSSDWTARVETYANNSPVPFVRRRLIVTGKVTTAAGLYASIALGPVSRLDEPVQQVLVRTEGKVEPGGAPVTQNVRGAFPARKRYGGIALRCGDGIIAEIRDIPIPPREKGENPWPF